MALIKSVLVFLIILVSVVIIITLGFFIVESMTSSEISETDLSEGTSFLLKESKELIFNLNEEAHKIIINSVNNDSVQITVQSELISVTLNIGETKKFDLNSDGIYDFSVKLNAIVDGKADIYIKKISEECIENWDCSEWNNCTEGVQTRTCEDKNACGTEKNKPDETQDCLLNCSDLEGYLCSTTETCNGTIINSFNGDCCLGECIEIETIACGTDIDCFIDKAGNCTLANMTYESDSSNSTWIQTATYYFRIRGFEGEKCEVYNELKDASRNFTASQWTTLLDANYTTEEINEMIQNINSNLKAGNTGVCRYSTVNLLEVLGIMKDEGYFELSSEDIDKYECTGNLFV